LIRYRYKIANRYRYFYNDKHANLIQAREQDVNVQQGSLLYVDTKMCQ